MKKILVIDDSEEIRSNIAELLRLSNYEVSEASDGKEGIQKSIAIKPDLIICDVMMPVMDGYGVLHAVHQNDPIRNTPFIFLTAKSEHSDLRKGMNLGADDYIIKPFDATELLNAVHARLEKMDQLKKEFSSGIQAIDALQDDSSEEELLKTLINNADLLTCGKRHALYSEGAYPNRLYYILEGRVKVYKTTDDGKELIIEIGCPGDFIGYSALLEGAPYEDGAMTLENAELAVIPGDQFQALISRSQKIAGRFIKMLAKNVSEKEKQLVNLAYHSLRKKVAVALLTLQKKFPQKEGYIMLQDLNRAGLATIAGTAKESLIRTLSDFRNEQLIDLNENSILIKNEKKLENMIN